MYYFVSAAWLVIVLVSWVQGNHGLPLIIGALGILVQVGIWYFGLGYIGISILAVLTAICMFSVPEIFFRG